MTRHYAPDGPEYHWPLDGTHAETGIHVRVSGYELWDLGDDEIHASKGHYDQDEYDRQVSADAG